MDNQEYERDCYGLQYDRKVGCIPRPRRLVRNEDGSLTENRRLPAISEQNRVTRIYERRYLLNELSKEVRAVMDDVIFASKCLQCLKGRSGDDATAFPGDVISASKCLQCLKGWSGDDATAFPGDAASKEYQKRKDIPREEHLLYGRLLQATMDRDFVVSAIEKYSRFLLSRFPIPHSSPTTKPVDDIVLLRIHKTDSNSPYHSGLGLFCGNWKNVQLDYNPEHKDFYNHMNNKRPPAGTPYISFHESPSKLITLQEYPGYRNSANRVLAFSLNSLKRLGTEVIRTTDLLAKTPYSKYAFKGDGKNFCALCPLFSLASSALGFRRSQACGHVAGRI